MSDTAHELFGEAVPNEALDSEEAAILRDGVGIALVEDAWVTIERVEEESVETWKKAKATGPGRDRRIIGEV